ncbi:MAG: hypothetical protein JRN15_07195, partial [Nitrososphaerota archaeon]|nr:hypothetical protein [Nitrososphaerota archaeon]
MLLSSLISLREEEFESLSNSMITSLPAISTGTFGYPIELASEVALETISNFLANAEQNPLDEISFVLFISRDLRIY